MDRPQCFCEKKVLGRFLFQTCLLTACSDFRKTVFDEIIVFKIFRSETRQRVCFRATMIVWVTKMTVWKRWGLGWVAGVSLGACASSPIAVRYFALPRPARDNVKVGC